MYTYAKTISLAAFAFIWANSAFAAGDFTKTCSNITINDNGLLMADCRTENGEIAEVSYNLNDRVGNEDGRLLWGGGRFSETSHCKLHYYTETTTLQCDTQKRDGSRASSSLNLDERIANINGSLRYRTP
jgi:CVNH domain